GFRSKITNWSNDKFGVGKVTLERDILAKVDRLNYGDMWDKGYNRGSNFANKISGVFNNDAMEGIASNVEGITGDTGKIADSMEISQEELRYLRDIAERDAINRFTTAEIKVDFKNESTIKSDMDIDGVMNKFTEKFREAIYTEAEGVHMLV
ncbi:MAG: hypothetical protein GX299_09950, partial [Epulopiscium sp.]|nr:hypothetical protein [Candidatus Epulonipiscium sp.]